MNKKRVAIVTGSAKGIGFECAKALAEDGCNVVIADIDEQGAKEAAQLLNTNEDIAFAVKVDVSSVESIEDMISKTVEQFGGIDVLVNNAGIISTNGVEDVTEAEWERVMNINLKSMFFTVQKALPYLKQSDGGKIINISSLAGRNGGITVGLPYAVSKAGAIGLTKAFASKLAEFNINVNCVAPGTTETEIFAGYTKEKIDYLKSCIPLKRLGQPGDIANSVAFFASEKASFITGAVLDVNGGMYFA